MSALVPCVHLQLCVCKEKCNVCATHTLHQSPQRSRAFRAPADVFPKRCACCGLCTLFCDCYFFFKHVLDGSDGSMFETASIVCSFLYYLPTCSSGDGWLGLSQGCLNRGLELAGGRTRWYLCSSLEHRSRIPEVYGWSSFLCLYFSSDPVQM